MYWKLLQRMSLGSPGLMFAYIFLTYAIPAIVIVGALRALENYLFH